MDNKITSVEVIGSGCANCKKLHEQAIAAAKDLGLDIDVGYSDNVQKALVLGVMQFPVMIVNGKAVLTGLADTAKIKAILKEAGGNPESSGHCSCGGNCGCR